ncbi:MAG: hypothetical protein ACRDRN_24100 [Sciscionella sp.]
MRGSPSATLDSLGPALGAGAFLGVAPAAGVTGWWLPVAVVLAGLVAALAGTARPLPHRAAPVALPGRVLAAAAVARCLGDYLVPSRPLYPAVLLLVLVAAGAAAAGVRVPVALRRAAAGVVLAVLGLVVISCFAIASPGNPPVAGDLPGADDLAALPTAAAIMVFGFGGSRSGGKRSAATLAAPVVVCLVLLLVALATLRQLGPGRLAISRAPLADALSAAGGAALVPLVLLGVIVAMLAVGLGAMEAVAATLPKPRAARSIGCLAACALAVVAAWLLTPTLAIATAGGCLLLEWLLAHVLVLVRQKGKPTSTTLLTAAGTVACAVLFAALPVRGMVGAAVLCALALGIAWLVSARVRR